MRNLAQPSAPEYYVPALLTTNPERSEGCRICSAYVAELAGLTAGQEFHLALKIKCVLV